MQTSKVDWARFEIPVVLMMIATVLVVLWQRFYYGIDLGSEALQILKVRDFIEGQGLFSRAPGFDQLPAYWTSQILSWGRGFDDAFRGLALELRRGEAGVLFGLILLLAFCLRCRVPVSWGVLFLLPLITYIPKGILGLNPWSWLMAFVVSVFILIWKGLFSPREFWSRAPPVLAILNLFILMGVVQIWRQDPEAFRDALAWQSFSLWQGSGGLPWSSLFEALSFSAWSLPIFLLSFLLAFLLPARFFHPAFVVLVAVVTLLFSKLGPIPGANWGNSELLILFLSPLVAAHLWRIRGSLSRTTRVRGSLLWIFIFSLSLGWMLGPVGASMPLIWLFIFSFFAGAERKLKFPVLVSAFSFSLCLSFNTYQQHPPGQAPQESLDRISHGVWEGLWTTRPEARMLAELEEDLTSLLPGAETLGVQGESIGLALIAPQTLLALEESPDLIVELPPDAKPEPVLLDYQLIKETPRYRILARRALVEEAMSKEQ